MATIRIAPVKRYIEQEVSDVPDATPSKVKVQKRSLNTLDSAPAPAPVPTPVPAPAPAPAVVSPVNQQAQPAADQESEYELHPQLQEILQYLADEDHVRVVKDKDLDNLVNKAATVAAEAVAARVSKMLAETMSTMEALLKQVKSESKSAQPIATEAEVTEVEAEVAVATVVETEAAPKPMDSPHVLDADPLLSLINEYAKTETMADSAVNKFNQLFDATFIYNWSGRAERYKNKLTGLGIKNCIVSNPSIPDWTTDTGTDTGAGNAQQRAAYFLMDIIDTACANGYRQINVVADVLLFHRNFGNVLHYAISEIQQTDWKLLQYCVSDRSPPINNQLDWQFYLDTNPDLHYTTETEAIEHWETLGALQGRVPSSQVVETESSNTLAFAIKSDIFPLLRDNLNLALGSNTNMGGLFE